MPQLMSFVELGGYPDLEPLYLRLGFQHQLFTSARKLIAALKRTDVAAVVVEFNYQTDFRDRTSSAESIIAAINVPQRCPICVLYREQERAQIDLLIQRFPFVMALPHPVDQTVLASTLAPFGDGHHTNH